MPAFDLFGCHIEVTDDTKTAVLKTSEGQSRTFHSDRVVSAQVMAIRWAKARSMEAKNKADEAPKPEQPEQPEQPEPAKVRPVVKKKEGDK